MDLTRLAVDAGQFINRAVQYTGESLGQADRTELDPGLEELLNRADATKTWTDQIISQTEVLLQPNPGARLEERLYEHLDWSAPPRPRAHDLLGDQMTQAGSEIGTNSPYGTALLRCGEAQKQLGEAHRKFVQSTNIHFLTPLRSYSEGEYRVIQDERKMLLNKRLDLDIAKTRLRKAHEAEQESRNLNANPLEVDYMSHVSYMFSFLRVKWLKMWAQEISQAEMELRICQSLYDRQSDTTKRLLDGMSNTHTNHMQSLTDFVEAQASYFAQCNQHAQELQRQLARIPAVLCSNNWQSAIPNAVNEPSTSNPAANEPVGLNQVTPISVVLPVLLPDFDQDSWTANPAPGAAKGKTDSSVITQPTDQTNNNNNNNFPTDNQATSHGSAANQAFDQVCPPTTPLVASNSTASSGSSRAAVDPPASSQTPISSETAAITNDEGSGPTTDPPPSQHSATAHESQAAASLASETSTSNETTSELPSTNGDIQEASSASQDVVQ